MAPSHAPHNLIEQRFQGALALHQRGALVDAERAYQDVLRLAPAHAGALHMWGVAALQAGRPDLAVERIRRSTQIDSSRAAPYSNLGLALQALGLHEEALACLNRALALAPHDPETLANQGNVLRSLERFEEALAAFAEAARLRPDIPQLHYNQALSLTDLKREKEALACLDRALRIDARFAEAHAHRAGILDTLDRTAEALIEWGHALQLKPHWPEAWSTRGMVLFRQRRLEEALQSIDRALDLSPRHREALINRGCVLAGMQRSDESLACFDAALAEDPLSAEAHYHRGVTLSYMRRFEDSLGSIDRSLALKPDHAAAHLARGYVLQMLSRAREAAQAYARVLECDPDHAFAKGMLLVEQMLICDWSRFDELRAQLRVDISMGKKAAEPFGHQAVAESPHELRSVAEIYCADRYPSATKSVWRGERYGHQKIRLGYLSGEFRSQATSILMTELFEGHDRDRFELYAFDNGWDDGSSYRKRINGSFDEIVAIETGGDLEVAQAIRAREIDVLVNLNGYFGFGRQGVFAYRPAPVQVNYLGFPGTIGAPYIDYILADTHVIPQEDHDAYVERVVYLPDTYQVNDSKRAIGRSTPTRAAVGLPESGFVFCCFNNSYKLTPEIFAVWTRLLASVPDSVLWLLEDNPAASENLRATLQASGLSPTRLVFAPRVELEEHLARHRLADLFLDTLPYNAHTTASDALWAGVPIVTCTGRTFPGRVAGSLLKALGLPELIAASLDEYELLAIQLATTPALLAEIRTKLNCNRASHPLFDTDRFRRHIEAAFTKMWECAERGQAPVSFSVEADRLDLVHARFNAQVGDYRIA